MRSIDRLVTRLRIVHDDHRPAEVCRSNARNTLQTAQWAKGFPRFTEYMKIEAAWRELAENQDWLDGKLYPAARPLSCI